MDNVMSSILPWIIAIVIIVIVLIMTDQLKIFFDDKEKDMTEIFKENILSVSNDNLAAEITCSGNTKTAKIENVRFVYKGDGNVNFLSVLDYKNSNNKEELVLGKKPDNEYSIGSNEIADIEFPVDINPKKDGKGNIIPEFFHITFWRKSDEIKNFVNTQDSYFDLTETHFPAYLSTLGILGYYNKKSCGGLI